MPCARATCLPGKNVPRGISPPRSPDRRALQAYAQRVGGRARAGGACEVMAVRALRGLGIYCNAQSRCGACAGSSRRKPPRWSSSGAGGVPAVGARLQPRAAGGTHHADVEGSERIASAHVLRRCSTGRRAGSGTSCGNRAHDGAGQCYNRLGCPGASLPIGTFCFAMRLPLKAGWLRSSHLAGPGSVTITASLRYGVLP